MGDLMPRVPCDACVRMSPRGIDLQCSGMSVEGPQGKSMDGGAEHRLLETDGAQMMIARHHRMVREQQQFLAREFVKCYL